MSTAVIQDSRKVYLVSESIIDEVCLGFVEEVINGTMENDYDELKNTTSGGPGQSLRSWFSDFVDELVKADIAIASLQVEIR